MILVTGASGFVGRHLVKELLSQGEKVRCFVRRTSDISHLAGAGIFYGDIVDKESLIKAAKNVKTIIHLVTTVGSADYYANYKVHVDGARNLIEACKKNNVRRIIVVSSVATLAKRKSNYGLTKDMADKIFMKSGLDITILKPDFIYGRDGRGFLAIVDIIKNYKIVPIIGHGNEERQPVHVDDVVAAIINSIKNKRSIGKTYIVASENPIRFIVMLDMIMERLDKKKPKIRLPVWMMLSLAYMMKVVKHPKLTRTAILGISQSRNYDVEPLVNELGVKPRSFEKGLEEVL